MLTRLRCSWILLPILYALLLIGCGQNGPGAGTAQDVQDPNVTPSTSQPDFVYSPLTLPVESPGDTFRISLSSEGVPGDLSSINADVDSTGRLVVFDSSADNLVAVDTNATWDIFLRDRRHDQTLRLSQTVAGFDANGASIEPKISADGRYVVFSSVADNLVADDSNQASDIFVYSIASATITRVSTTALGGQANGASITPAISGDGRWIVYSSVATNLLNETQSDAIHQIYLYDRELGSVQRISNSVDGKFANADCFHPAISRNGNVVAYDSAATDLLVRDLNQQADIFVYERGTQQTTRVSISSAGEEANSSSATPALNADGGIVAFQSDASNLVAEDTNKVRDIFVHNRVNKQTRRTSVASNGEQGNATFFASPDLSDSGDQVTFYGQADNLSSDDQNQSWDAFVHHIYTGQTDLISRNSAAEIGNSSSFEPAISGGGHYVVFGSQASNLVANDSNAAWDIFLHVLNPINYPPSVTVSADPIMGKPPLLVQFSSQATDVEEDGLLYQWDFGDGSGSTETNPAHDYLEPGHYTAVLTVMDPEYATQASIEIQVISPLNVTVHWVKLEQVHSHHTRREDQIHDEHDAGMELKLELAFEGDVQLDASSPIRVDFAGHTLLDTSLGEFTHLGGMRRDRYKLDTASIEAILDLQHGRLKLSRREIVGGTFTAFNDLPLVLTLGGLRGSEIVTLQPMPCSERQSPQFISDGDDVDHARPGCEHPKYWIYHKPRYTDHDHDHDK